MVAMEVTQKLLRVRKRVRKKKRKRWRKSRKRKVKEGIWVRREETAGIMYKIVV